MASAETQAEVNKLNLAMQSASEKVLDEVERVHLRPIARHSYQCIVNCYDKAGKTGSNLIIQQCGNQCQLKYQQAQKITNQVRVVT